MFRYRKKDIIWAAGLLEGEGYFGAYPASTRKDGSKGYKIVVECGMTDEDVIQHLWSIIPWASHDKKYRQSENHKMMYRLRLNQADKVVAFCQELYPYMGTRRRKQMDKIFAVYKSMNGRGHRQSKLPDTLLGADQDVIIGLP